MRTKPSILAVICGGEPSGCRKLLRCLVKSFAYWEPWDFEAHQSGYGSDSLWLYSYVYVYIYIYVL